MMATPLLGSDLLSDDNFSFESTLVAAEPAWYDRLEWSIQHLTTQGASIEAQRSSVGVEYEFSPWEGGFFRVDDRYTYYWHHDKLTARADRSRTPSDAYARNKLNELWLQQSNDACYLKAGRQTLLWGAVEGTFAVDQLTPFDFTEALFTDYAEIRRPQDMIRAECFSAQTRWQVFITPRASLSRVKHRDTAIYDTLEDELAEEFGISAQHSLEGMDVSLLYARLYADLPVYTVTPGFAPSVQYEVARYDLFALSAVKAIRRLLVELDVGYRRDQTIAVSGAQNDQLEIALGFEYTTAGNHQLNGGVWSYHFDEANAGLTLDAGTRRVEQITAGWNKTYLNDDLTMSLLGSWVEHYEQSRLTIQGKFQLNDYWQTSSALGYTDNGDLERSETIGGGWEVSLMLRADI